MAIAWSSQARTPMKAKRSVATGSGVTWTRVCLALGVPQAQHRRMQKLLPRMRPDGIAEQRVVVAASEPVAPAVLLVGPTRRQVGERDDIVIDDRLIAHGRADDAIAPLLEEIEHRRPVLRA